MIMSSQSLTTTSSALCFSKMSKESQMSLANNALYGEEQSTLVIKLTD